MKAIQILAILLLCLGFSLPTLNANSFYEKGDSMYVWAVSGLNMREGPGTDFPKMKRLDYGDRVEVIDNYLRSTPLDLTVVGKTKNTDAFTLKGFWVRVKIGTQEGYVFDGYLSKLPVFKISSQYGGRCGDKGVEWIKDYLERSYEQLEKVQNLSEYGEGTIKIKYDSAITLDQTIENGSSIKITIPKMSHNEALVFFNLYTGFETCMKQKEQLDNLAFKVIQKDDNFSGFTSDGAHEDITFTFKNGLITITIENYC